MLKVRNIKKVLLVDPQGFSSGLNLGLAYVAAVLKKAGYEVKVVDCNNDPERLSQGPALKLSKKAQEDWRVKVKRGLDWQPDAVGLSINSFTQFMAYDIAEYCHRLAGEDLIYFAGGPHVTVSKEEFIRNNKKLFDYGIIGEGEETTVELLGSLSNPAAVKGLTYFDEKLAQVVKTEDRKPIVNLDSLPFAQLDVFDTVITAGTLYNYQISSSRGCPYRCVFCSQILTRVWRPRSPEHVIAELTMAKEKYRMKTVTFWDDNFSLDVNRAKKICDLLISENIDVQYDLAGVRADRIDEELLQKLKDSGCQSMFIGIEDGDPETFPFVGKGETLEAIEKAVQMVKKSGIQISSYMITGLINSNYSSFLRSLDFVQKLGIPAHWNVAFPLPNTKLAEWVKENGRMLMTAEDGFKFCMTSNNPPIVFDTPEYPREQRLKAYYVGNLRCRSYDMIVSSHDANLFRQAWDIMFAVVKYDPWRFWWHLSYLLKMFFSALANSGRVASLRADS